MQELVTLLTNAGVSIGMLAVLCWYVNKLTDKHEKETEEFTNAINKLALSFQALSDKVDDLINKKG